MTTTATRLEDVDYYLSLYDEDGDMDPEAYYHRSQLARGRDFAQSVGLTGISDHAAYLVRVTFPEIDDAASLAPEIRNALIGLGTLIDHADPEDSASEDRMDAAIADLRVQITTQ